MWGGRKNATAQILPPGLKKKERRMNTQGDKGPQAEATEHTGAADGLSQGTRF